MELAASFDVNGARQWVGSLAALAFAIIGLSIMFVAVGNRSGQMRKVMERIAIALVGVACIIGAGTLAGVNILSPFIK